MPPGARRYGEVGAALRGTPQRWWGGAGSSSGGGAGGSSGGGSGGGGSASRVDQLSQLRLEAAAKISSWWASHVHSTRAAGRDEGDAGDEGGEEGASSRRRRRLVAPASERTLVWLAPEDVPAARRVALLVAVLSSARCRDRAPPAVLALLGSGRGTSHGGPAERGHGPNHPVPASMTSRHLACISRRRDASKAWRESCDGASVRQLVSALPHPHRASAP